MSGFGDRYLKGLLLKIKSDKVVPTLSSKQEKFQYYFAITGTVISTILAFISLFLSYWISQTTTKIEKMDSLLHLLTIQNSKQDEAINKLTSIQETSLDQTKKLSEQINVIKEQTAFFQESNSPDVTLTNIDFVSSNLNRNENLLTYSFFNNGGRALKSLNSEVLVFLPVKDSIYYLITLKPTISPNNTTDLRPKSSNTHFLNIPKNEILDSIFQNACITVVANYIDPLTKKKSSRPFFFRTLKGVDGKFVGIYASPSEYRIMSRFMDTSKIFKRFGN